MGPTRDIRRRARRGLAVLATATMCLFAAACAEEDLGGTSPPEEGPLTVSMTVANVKLNFAREMSAGFRYGVGAVPGVSADVQGPDIVDGAAQLRMFEAQTVASAGSAVFTLNPEIFAQALSETVGRGVPVVAVDNPPAPNSGVELFVGNDNAALGRLLARQVVARLPRGTRGGSVVIGTTGPGASVLDRRVEGMMAEFRARIPGVRLLGPFDTRQEPEANEAAWRVLVRANPQAWAFVGTGDADAAHLGALRQETQGRWVAGGFDLDPVTLTAVKRGDLVVVSPEHFLKGAVAGRLLALHARNGTPLPQGWVETPGLGVTSANVDEVIARQASDAARQAYFAEQINRLARFPALHPMPAS